MRTSAHTTMDEHRFDAFDDFAAEDLAGDYELTCPSCDHLLSGDSFYERFRVCPQCKRHFWLPARERVGIVADHDSFRETNSTVVSIEPLIFQDSPPSNERATSQFPAGETVVSGRVTIGGREAVLVVVDMAMTPGSIGIVTGERICLAFEDAAQRRVPLVAICSGGVQTDRESLLTFAQKVRIASVVGRLQRNGVPFVSVLTHPTTGAFFTGLGNHANLIYAEPAAQLGLGPNRSRGPIDLGTASSEEMLAAGMIDGIVERTSLRDRLVAVLDVMTSRGTPRPTASPVWTSVPRGRGSDDPAVVRAPARPDPGAYLELMHAGLIEIHGDRTGTSDPNLIAGIGQIEGVTVGLIGVRRAPLTAEGFRTAVRLYRLAGQLEIPVISLIDSPGLPEVSAIEGAALSNAIAQAMRVAVSLPIPTIAIVTGVAAGPGAMSLTVADRVYMLEHALYSTSGLDRPTPPGITPAAPGGMWGGRESLRLGIVDGVIPEPAGGAQADPDGAAQQIRLTIVHALAELNGIGHRRLLDERSRKLRHLGLATPAGREALHIEIAQLHEIQQSLGRSIDELRGRLELYQLGLPNLPSLPQRPANVQLPPFPQIDLPVLPTRPSLPAMRRPGRARPEMSNLAERFAATRRGLTERMHEMRYSPESVDQPAPKEPPIDE
jgi:acetyl-CoA carboxylase carboxyl transferase subunit beta